MILGHNCSVHLPCFFLDAITKSRVAIALNWLKVALRSTMKTRHLSSLPQLAHSSTTFTSLIFSIHSKLLTKDPLTTSIDTKTNTRYGVSFTLFRGIRSIFLAFWIPMILTLTVQRLFIVAFLGTGVKGRGRNGTQTVVLVADESWRASGHFYGTIGTFTIWLPFFERRSVTSLLNFFS